MKRFIIRFISISLIFFLLSPIYFYLKWYEADYKNLHGSEIYHALNKSKKKNDKVKKLLIGDSIAMQAYSCYEYNGRIYSLACNQAISLVGHYILLKNFLENNSHTSDLEVIMVFRPNSFKNDLNQIFTFNYFLKPFYFDYNYPHFTEYVFNQIEKIPFYFAVKIPLIRKSRWSPKYNVQKIKLEEAYLSKISISYLKKIQSLCDTHGISRIRMFCPFISDEFSMQNFEQFNLQLHKDGLNSLFEGYYDKTVFLPKKLFRDRIHLKNAKKVLGQNYLEL